MHFYPVNSVSSNPFSRNITLILGIVFNTDSVCRNYRPCVCWVVAWVESCPDSILLVEHLSITNAANSVVMRDIVIPPKPNLLSYLCITQLAVIHHILPIFLRNSISLWHPTHIVHPGYAFLRSLLRRSPHSSQCVADTAEWLSL